MKKAQTPQRTAGTREARVAIKRSNAWQSRAGGADKCRNEDNLHQNEFCSDIYSSASSTYADSYNTSSSRRAKSRISRHPSGTEGGSLLDNDIEVS